MPDDMYGEILEDHRHVVNFALMNAVSLGVLWFALDRSVFAYAISFLGGLAVYLAIVLHYEDRKIEGVEQL